MTFCRLRAVWRQYTPSSRWNVKLLFAARRLEASGPPLAGHPVDAAGARQPHDTPIARCLAAGHRSILYTIFTRPLSKLQGTRLYCSQRHKQRCVTGTAPCWSLILIAGSLAVALLIGVLNIGLAFAQGPGGMMGGSGPFGPQGGGYGPGWMFGSTQTYSGTLPYGHGPGMMGGGYGYGMMGMMGGYASNALFGIEPLALDEAQTAVEGYLARLGNEDLVVGEVMVFENHAYAQLVERSTGIGALEVLVDPVTLTVTPEPGPNMMWNTKYGPMSGFSGFGMMGSALPGTPTEPPLGAEDAVASAQRYLDAYLPGAEADEHADPFYGYYTLHVLRNGETVGMLSVNGYTGQVFLHTWHGDLVEMSGE